MPKPIEPTHLGDGVYAAFDGYHVTLHVGDQRNPPVVFLEPPVIRALLAYSNQVFEYQRAQFFEQHDKTYGVDNT